MQQSIIKVCAILLIATVNLWSHQLKVTALKLYLS